MLRRYRCDLTTLILLVLLALTVGVIVGALLSFIMLLNLGAIIAFGMVLIVLLVTRFVTAWCYKQDLDKNS